MMFLNIASPHTIYIRTIEQRRPPISQFNGINNIVKAMINGGGGGGGMDGTANADANNQTTSAQLSQLFAQSNGQIAELCNERVAIKSVWEYFLEKNSNT